ncbi:MAG: GNAT family N-acetyltransferase [Oscillospiraceae bacterium]|nr:GNAT family N-acetyltransferase [Oscillospiraceae bacterium]
MQFQTKPNRILCIEDGAEVGYVTFPEREAGVFEIDHTVVDKSMQGRGVAAQLVRLAIQEIHRQGGTVTASCSYAQKYLEKHGLRPLVICHMVTSIDGKVTGDFLYSETGLRVCEDYYAIHRALGGEAFACGRVTMESSFTNGFRPDVSAFSGEFLPDGDYIAKHHGRYAVSFDTCGVVGWTDGLIHDEDAGYDDRHIIEIVTERTAKEMLAYYRKIGVSYLFAGTDKIDIGLALQKLYDAFGIRLLLLEGGSIINGAFLRAGLVDELSLVVSPAIADRDDKPLCMDADMTDFRLISVETRGSGAVWMRYTRSC